MMNIIHCYNNTQNKLSIMQYGDKIRTNVRLNILNLFVILIFLLSCLGFVVWAIIKKGDIITKDTEVSKTETTEDTMGTLLNYAIGAFIINFFIMLILVIYWIKQFGLIQTILFIIPNISFIIPIILMLICSKLDIQLGKTLTLIILFSMIPLLILAIIHTLNHSSLLLPEEIEQK